MTRLFLRYTDCPDETVIHGVNVPHIESISWTLDGFRDLTTESESAKLKEAPEVFEASECQHLDDTNLQIHNIFPSSQLKIISIDTPEQLDSNRPIFYLYMVVIEESGGGQSYNNTHYVFFEFSKKEAFRRVVSYFQEEHNRDEDCESCRTGSKQCKQTMRDDLNKHSSCVIQTSDYEESLATVYKIPLPRHQK
jgi:hypothetical protein